ncbi:branched-chain amino acid transaminase [Bacteriovoracales bacterium]|nr:branched-chain amino acid transaminase [Bacteriovoracales bacterium]
MNVESKFVWHQGKLVPYEKATIHFLNTSFHYGTGVFEGLRAYDTSKGPAIFRLKDHMERLLSSAKILGVNNLPYDLDTLMESCKEVVKANDLKEAYIRPMFYAREGGWGLSLKETVWDYSVAAWRWDKYHGNQAKNEGIKAKVSSYNRNHINVSLTKGKICGNYVNSVLAKAEAQRSGVQEAIMLDSNGFVAECTGQNLFIVKKGQIKTPVPHLILEGLTRDTIFSLIEDENIPLEEMILTRDHLYLADEVFIVGTANEILPMVEIDGITIGDGKPGPTCRKLQELYEKLIHGKLEKYWNHLDWV